MMQDNHVRIYNRFGVKRRGSTRQLTCADVLSRIVADQTTRQRRRLDTAIIVLASQITKLKSRKIKINNYAWSF